MSCGTEKYVQFVYADLRAFGEQKSASKLQFEAFEAVGGLKREQSIVWHDVTCSWTTSGNEAVWGNLELLNIAPPKSALREKWIAMLQEKYHDIDTLNNAWNTHFESWQAVETMPQPKSATDALNMDYLRLEQAFAEQYFSFMATTIKQYDPNHLYLGCRFTRRLKPDHILATAGKYCDVITVNVYSLVPMKEQMEQWHRKTGRPLLIGEHHLPLCLGVLGDVITLVDAPFIHGHLTVKGYRESLQKINSLLDRLQVESVLMVHFPPSEPGPVKVLINQAHHYLDKIENAILQILKHRGRVNLQALWPSVCDTLEKTREFRALSTVYAHIEDLRLKNVIIEHTDATFSLKEE
ncbi:MAG: beta-galactosidase [Cytophagales bacterium]|nr:beta-galactosidase [Cytophagales bacterium]